MGDDCYKFIVIDTCGDGVQWWADTAQGTGFIRIKNESGNIIKTFEPDFGGGFEFSFTTDFAISIEELEFLTSLKVFPNPANNFATIEADDFSDATVYLTDILGQSIAAPVISRSDQAISFDIQNLDSGIYFIVVSKKGVSTTRKLIVE